MVDTNEMSYVATRPRAMRDDTVTGERRLETVTGVEADSHPAPPVAGHAPTRPLRVCVVLPSVTRGGAEIWQERVAARDGSWDLHVAAPEGSDALAPWRARGVPTYEFRAGRRLRGAAGTVTDLVRTLRRVRPDVVVAHGVKAGLLAAVAAQIGGARVVWVRHDDSFERLTHVLDTLTDARVVVADSLRGGSSATLVEPPLAGDPASREASLDALGWGEEHSRRRLLMATRLVPYKGVDVAIDAMVGADDWELHVFGVTDHAHPDERTRLEAHARELGVSERVTFHDPRDDIALLMPAFDAVALLTRAEPGSHVTAEAFGLTAYEGLRAGLPVIAASPVGETMGHAGVLVDPTNPDDVARALATCADDAARRRMLEAAPGVLAEHALDPKQASTQLTHVLDAVAARPGAGVAGDTPFSVVTTVLNEAAGLQQLLDQLRPLLRADDEILVVDGGSRDGTLEVAQAVAADDPRVTVVAAPGAGISEGRNIGVRAARHDWIACTDVGCAPSATWLEAFRSAVTAHPEAGLLTGVYSVSAGTPVEHSFAACGYPDVGELRYPTAFSRSYSRLFGRGFEARMPTGRSVAFTRGAWREAGGYPENLPTGEDVSFGQTVARRRPAYLVADSETVWDQRASVRGTLQMYFTYGEGSVNSRNTTLLVRDGARLVAWLTAAAVYTCGGRRARTVASGALAVYFSLPMARAARRPNPLATMAWTPFTIASRDLAKVAGALSAGLHQARRRVRDDARDSGDEGQ